MTAAAPEVVILDDLCATGGTLVRAAQACREGGARRVHVAVTHAPLAAGLRTLLDAGEIASVVVTDSVGLPLQQHARSSADHGKLTVLPIAPLFGEAVRRMLRGVAVAPLLRQWPAPHEE
jgi:ribose-phosphate pyrophosphokinase